MARLVGAVRAEPVGRSRDRRAAARDDQGEPAVQAPRRDAPPERPEPRPPRRGPVGHAGADGPRAPSRTSSSDSPTRTPRGPPRGRSPPGTSRRSPAEAPRTEGAAGRGSPEGPAASLQGDLEVFGLPALLQSLADSSASGTLTLREPKGGPVFATLVLREGKLEQIRRGQALGRRRVLPAPRASLPGPVRVREGSAAGRPRRDAARRSCR